MNICTLYICSPLRLYWAICCSSLLLPRRGPVVKALRSTIVLPQQVDAKKSLVFSIRQTLTGRTTDVWAPQMYTWYEDAMHEGKGVARPRRQEHSIQPAQSCRAP